MTAAALESAILVPVPEAEPLVSNLRAEHDPAAAAGIPAHITLLYPFAPPDDIDHATIDALRAMFAASAAFRFVLREPRWFGDEVLYLEPDPAAPFVWMTERLAVRFPEYAPYGGAFDELVPHLTVAMRGSAAIEQVLREALPVAAVASEALLMEEGEDAMWRVRERFRFGARE